MNDIQGLARFVASVIRMDDVVSVRLREGDDRAKALQIGRIAKTAESTASALQKSIVERVDGAASTHCIHIEAMSVNDKEIYDYVTALPVRATKVEKREAGDVAMSVIQTMALDCNERADRAINTIQDMNETLREVERKHAEERLEWLEENQELRKRLEAKEPPPNPLVESALDRAMGVGEKLLVAYGMKQLGVKAAKNKALPGPTSTAAQNSVQTPSATTTNAEGAAELTVIEGGKSAADDAPELGLTEEEVQLAEYLSTLRSELLVVAGQDEAYPGILAEHYIAAIVGMMESHKAEFTGERLGLLIPHLDMGVIMAAFTSDGD